MGGWQKPVKPPRRPTWVDEVHALYLRDPNMETDELEQLLDVAVTGRRPDHTALPARLGLQGLPPRPRPDELTSVRT